jgi:hypothetical protein
MQKEGQGLSVNMKKSSTESKHSLGHKSVEDRPSTQGIDEGREAS